MKKENKGIIQQMKDAKEPIQYDISLDKITKVLEEMIIFSPKRRNFIISTGCLKYGYITRDSSKPFDMVFCDLPDCKGCRTFENALKEGVAWVINELNKIHHGKI